MQKGPYIRRAEAFLFFRVPNEEHYFVAIDRAGENLFRTRLQHRCDYSLIRMPRDDKEWSTAQSPFKSPHEAFSHPGVPAQTQEERGVACRKRAIPSLRQLNHLLSQLGEDRVVGIDFQRWGRVVDKQDAHSQSPPFPGVSSATTLA